MRGKHCRVLRITPAVLLKTDPRGAKERQGDQLGGPTTIEAREDAWTGVVGLEVLGNGQILVTRTHTHFFIIETSKEEQTV